MSNKEIPTWCRKAADSILHDLSDRRHIRCVLEIIDEDVMKEIKETMVGIIMQESAIADQLAAPQPAPDVSPLVEALKWLRGAINCTPENDKNQSGTWISTSHPRIRQIDELLAAHRKGGEA